MGVRGSLIGVLVSGDESTKLRNISKFMKYSPKAHRIIPENLNL